MLFIYLLMNYEYGYFIWRLHSINLYSIGFVQLKMLVPLNTDHFCHYGDRSTYLHWLGNWQRMLFHRQQNGPH